MTKTIHSTLTLTQYTAKTLDQKPISITKTDKLLKQLLTQSKRRQQNGLSKNKTVNCLIKTRYSNHAARNLELPLVPTNYTEKFQTLEMDKSEVWRLLVSWQQRTKLAKVMKKNNWELTFKESKTLLNEEWLDYELYKNVLRSKSIPKLPRIKTPRLVTSKTAPQYCTLKWKNNKIYFTMTLINKKYILEFIIPNKIQQRHSNITKICKPTIRQDKLSGKIMFDFAIEEKVEEGQALCDSVLAVDPGKTKTFSAVRVYSYGTYSEEFIESIDTKRHKKALEKFDREIALLSKKNKQRELLGLHNFNAIEEERILRLKRKNTRRELAWSATSDVVKHSKPGETISLEDNKFNTGGSLRWNNGEFRLALEHRARRDSIPYTTFDSKYASHECPKCFSFIAPEEESRVSSCDCGWLADRDYTAAIIGGLRTHNKKGVKKVVSARVSKSRDKCVPTPKRPRKRSVRRNFSLPDRDISWVAFTGVNLNESPDEINLVANSLVGESQSLNSIVYKT